MKTSELHNKFLTIKADVKREGSAALTSDLTELMSKYPEIECAHWHQNTPYNDGDTEYFCVSDIKLEISNENIRKLWNNPDLSDEDAEDMRCDGLRYFIKDSNSPYVVQMFKDLYDIEKHFDHDFMKMMFGDGVEIAIKRDGSCKVSKYTDY